MDDPVMLFQTMAQYGIAGISLILMWDNNRKIAAAIETCPLKRKR